MNEFIYLLLLLRRTCLIFFLITSFRAPMAETTRHGDIVAGTEIFLRTVFVYSNENI